MTTAVYGFSGALETVARHLAIVLGCEMHRNQSPMIGPWYSSEAPPTLEQTEQLRRTGTLPDGDRPGASKPRYKLTLVLNNPEPGYGSRSYPGDWGSILNATALPEQLDELHELLSASFPLCQRLE